MFSYLFPILYVRVSPERLTVRNVKSQNTISEIPEVAIRQGSKGYIAGIGAEASDFKGMPNMVVINPFAHPRSMVSDFTVAEHLLKRFFQKALRSGLYQPSPKVVMHLLGEPQGGFTQVERRAFREMAIGAGASRVALWTGPSLTDQEVPNGDFGGDNFSPERHARKAL